MSTQVFTGKRRQPGRRRLLQQSAWKSCKSGTRQTETHLDPGRARPAPKGRAAPASSDEGEKLWAKSRAPHANTWGARDCNRMTLPVLFPNHLLRLRGSLQVKPASGQPKSPCSERLTLIELPASYNVFSALLFHCRAKNFLQAPLWAVSDAPHRPPSQHPKQSKAHRHWPETNPTPLFCCTSQGASRLELET